MKAITLLAGVLLVGCSKDDMRNRPPEEIRQVIQKAMQVGDYARAERGLSTLLQSNPQDFDALVGRAAVHVLSGHAKKAQQDFEAAVKTDPEQGEKARFFVCDRAIWQARRLDMAQQYGAALKIYDALLTIYPRSGAAYHDRGGVKTSMKDYEGAIGDLTKAIEFDEGNNAFGDSYVLRARARRAKGDQAGAIGDEAKAKEQAASTGRRPDTANGSQPLRSETNRTSSAAGSRR
jgi:Tfp pilus assembly protein PilF